MNGVPSAGGDSLTRGTLGQPSLGRPPGCAAVASSRRQRRPTRAKNPPEAPYQALTAPQACQNSDVAAGGSFATPRFTPVVATSDAMATTPMAASQMVPFADLAASSGAPPAVVDYLTARGMTQTPPWRWWRPTTTRCCRPSSPRWGGHPRHPSLRGGLRQTGGPGHHPTDVVCGASPVAGSSRPPHAPVHRPRCQLHSRRQRPRHLMTDRPRPSWCGRPWWTPTSSSCLMAPVASSPSYCMMSTPSPSPTTCSDLARSCRGELTTPLAQSITLPPFRRPRHGAASRRSRLFRASCAPEDVINRYLDWYIERVRQRAAQMQQVHDYWWACSWRIAIGMRQSRSFHDMADKIMADVAPFQEAIHVAPPHKGPASQSSAWAHLGARGRGA